MEPSSPEPAPFTVKDCALAALAAGRQAHHPSVFRDRLLRVHLGGIFYHSWSGLLNARLEERECHIDFGGGRRHAVRAVVLGERLAEIDSGDFADLAPLRRKWVEMIEERLDERECRYGCNPAGRLNVSALKPRYSTHSWGVPLAGSTRQPYSRAIHRPHFYCAIAARRRVKRRVDDFSVWLSAFGGAYPLSCRKTGRRRCTGASAPIPRSRRRYKPRVSTALRMRWA